MILSSALAASHSSSSPSKSMSRKATPRSANAKFKRRFGRVEAMVAERGVALRDLDFEALDELWDAAKAEERITT